jgi:hypothetical protein
MCDVPLVIPTDDSITIVSGTKRQHVTEQLSLIPIKNRGELRTQVI